MQFYGSLVGKPQVVYMKTFLFHWVKTNRVILANAVSLISTTGVTSALGFVYWWVAARQFSPASVGLASASISAMALLGSISLLGFGTLLIGEVSRHPKGAASLITTALAVSGTAGGILGAAFAFAAPWLSPDIQPLAASIWTVLIFAVGVSLTAITLVLDQALIGLLRGNYQFLRNAFFAVAKLVILCIVGFWGANKSGLTIYISWWAGTIISLAFLAALMVRKRLPLSAYYPQWQVLRQLRRAALGHHALNLALEGPVLTLPVLVTILLSTTTNAYFYAAWMIANFIFIVPSSFTTVLYAVGSARPEALARTLRQTITVSAAACLAANILLLFLADFTLNIFGPAYAEQAEGSLRILALGAFAIIIRTHYIALTRIHRRINEAALIMFGSGLLELVLATVGAKANGLTGLSMGWVAAVYLEAALFVYPVYRAAISTDSAQWISIPAYINMLWKKAFLHTDSRATEG